MKTIQLNFIFCYWSNLYVNAIHDKGLCYKLQIKLFIQIWSASATLT